MGERLKSVARGLRLGAGLATGAYAAYVAATWLRYGHTSQSSREGADDVLDSFMPRYDVVERHHVHISAPAAITLAAAKEMQLSQLPGVSAIFKARELILGSTPDQRSRPRGIVDETIALGWVVLSDVPDREIVLGAVTRPWEADVVFRSIPPDEFADFSEPGYVKMAWTLRADSMGDDASTFRTETRAVATDAGARRRFRCYWSLLSPGIILIRWLSLAPLKQDAERRTRMSESGLSVAQG